MKRVNTCILSIFLVYVTCLSMIDISQINLENPIPEHLNYLNHIEGSSLEKWYEELYQQHNLTLNQFFPDNEMEEINENLIAFDYNPYLFINGQQCIVTGYMKPIVNHENRYKPLFHIIRPNKILKCHRVETFIVIYNFDMIPIKSISLPIEEECSNFNCNFITAISSNPNGEIAIAMQSIENNKSYPIIYRYNLKTNSFFAPIQLSSENSIISALSYINNEHLAFATQHNCGIFQITPRIYGRFCTCPSAANKIFYLLNTTENVIQNSINIPLTNNIPIYSIKYDSQQNEYLFLTLQDNIFLYNQNINKIELLLKNNNTFRTSKLFLPGNKTLSINLAFHENMELVDFTYKFINIKNFKKLHPLSLVCALKLFELHQKYCHTILAEAWRSTYITNKPIDKIHDDWIDYFNQLPTPIKEKFIVLIKYMYLNYH